MPQDTTGELAEFRRFILTAVKPASEDYCRGCHMASYPGDSLDTTCSTLAEVEEILLPELSRELGPNEDGWDWTLRGVDCDLAEKYGRPAVEAWIEDDQEGGS